VRIGQGVDAHRFSADETRPLWIGLTKVDSSPGLDGHSDADVLAHALGDALLGAAGLGDLGQHFPPSEEWRAASGETILQRIVHMVAVAGFRPISADTTVVAERPRLAALTSTMSERLSDVLGAPVSVKCTSTDGLGALGRGEGIAANAVVLLEETT
jgi:2-C-methyl-D-erythritol 2,4-cyclodiphosphate synthase